MDFLPASPVMLLSVVNTKLRDNYNSLKDLCSDMNADYTQIIESLKSIGYEYNEELNQFI